MNKARREAIVKLTEKIEDIRLLVQEQCDDETAYFDAMPEGIQTSERGQVAESAISALEEAGSALEEAIAQLEAAVQP